MKKTQLYLLALILAVLGVAGFYYKWKVLRFPVSPQSDSEVWEVQARVEFIARSGPNKVTLPIPHNPPGYSVIDENFVARNYGMNIERSRGAREVQWQIRRASGTQALYYRATIYRDDHPAAEPIAPTPPEPKVYEEPFATARATLLDQVREKSVDSTTFASALVRQINARQRNEEVALLLGKNDKPEDRPLLAIDLLADRQISARLMYGFELNDGSVEAELKPFLRIWDTDLKQWRPINAITGAEGLPENLFVWSTAQKPVLTVDDNPRAHIAFSLQRSLADALDTAMENLRSRDENFIAYSLLNLPIETQQTFKILLLVPVGAFIMLILRNLVGIKTFGTFMPVLVALAFNWTGLVAGLILFALIISLGLLVRFYMERLKLLLVPRLTAVLIIVVLLMALVSVVSNKLGFNVGLSVALFPMIILTMTIERVSVAWEERGAGYAIKQALGSLAIAALAYMAMGQPRLQHLIFVFPELLLVLLAVTLLLGRYSGYRLSELLRFRALARDPDPIAPPPAKPDAPAGA
ncbi:MAG: inactive transglutaminase family protein [Rhodanobacteraceae bacterium]|nr:inactive transglutaminase family protein [Rhodanobacteraceae bacterium]